jgi:hypothetical protein
MQKHTGIRLLFSLLLLVTVGFLSAWSTDNFLEELQKKYNSFQHKYPQVKINLTFNQDEYFVEDTLFFSSWYLYEDLKVVKGSHVINVDIISGNGKTVQSIRFKIQDGRGHNQIIFNNNLAPGIYRMVAYTDWMKNFGMSTFFQRDLKIVSRKQITKKDLPSAHVEFYPEGGNLPQGVNNHVIVIGTPFLDLEIKDGNATVGNVVLNAVGLGTLNLKPASNAKYYASRGTERWDLPAVENEGIAIKLEKDGAWKLTLKVAKQSKYISKEIYVVGVTEGKIVMKDRIKIDQSESPFTVSIPSQKDTEGYMQIFVLDSEGVEIAQRVFVPSFENLLSVKLKLQPQIKQRENVSFSLGILDQTETLQESEMSITVFQSNLFNQSKSENYFYLSDIFGVSEWINSHEGAKEQLNDYLISKKWNRIDWESILKNKKVDILFPFQNQIKLKGSLSSIVNDSPAKDSTHVLSFLQENAIGYDGYTKNGVFEIPLFFDFWGDDKVFYTAEYNEKSIDNFYTFKPIRDSIDVGRWNSGESAENSIYGDYAFKRNLINRSYFFFQSQQVIDMKPKSLNQTLEEEFQGADQSLNAKDYIVFPSMKDFIHEVVPFIQYREKKGKPSIRLFFRREKSVMFYKNDPLYIINGIMSKNTATFLDIKPEDLISIKIINSPNKLAQLGKLGENGVVFIESKANKNRALNQNIFPVTGLSRPVLNANTNSARKVQVEKPDLRSTLYWNPSFKSSLNEYKELTFVASDDEGLMMMRIEGLTSNGKAFFLEKEFKVELNPNRKK